MLFLSAAFLLHAFIYLAPEDLRRIGGERYVEHSSPFRYEAPPAVKVKLWQKNSPPLEFKTLTLAEKFAEEKGYEVLNCGNGRLFFVETLKGTLRFKPGFDASRVSDLASGEWQSLSIIIYSEGNRTVVKVKGKAKDVKRFINVIRLVYSDFLLSVSVYPRRKLVCGG